MRKIFNVLIAALLLTAVWGCNRGYTILGEIPVDECNGATVYLDNVSDGIPVDSTIIANGAFQFTGKVEGSKLASLVVTNGMTRYMSNIVLENGTIRINLVNDSLSGTPMNDLYFQSFTADTVAIALKKQLDDCLGKYYTAVTPEEQVSAAAEYNVVQSQLDAHNLAVARRVYEQNKDNISVGWNTLGRMKEGDYVAILNAETMGPVTYKEMMTDSEVIEVLDLDEAIERAAKWLVDELLESVFSFSLFTPYFLLAFRLALMQGSWPENLRFAEARLNEEWHKTLSSVLFFAGQKLQQEAIGISKRERQIWFNLPENKIEDYLYALNDEE